MRAKFKVESVTQQDTLAIVQLQLAYRKYEDPSFDSKTGTQLPPVLAFDGSEPFDAVRDGARAGSVTVVCYTPEAAAAFVVGKTFWLADDEE